jgi:hypothetical protein
LKNENPVQFKGENSDMEEAIKNKKTDTVSVERKNSI